MVGRTTGGRARDQRLGHDRILRRAFREAAHRVVTAHRAGGCLVRLCRAGGNVVPCAPITRLDFRTAARFADQYATGLRAGDALHLAVAADHGVRIGALDRTLVSAAEALGVSAALVEV